MAQLSLYIDDALMTDLRERAGRQNKSLSKYVREKLSTSCKDEDRKWPDSFWATFGAITDPTFTAPAELDWANDATRLTFD